MSAARSAEPVTDYRGLRARLDAAVGRAAPAWLASHREDIVQACVIRVLVLARKRPDLAVNGAYLRRVARSATIDYIRRLRPGRELPYDPDRDEPAVAGHATDATIAYQRLRLRRAIEASLARLPAQRRVAVCVHLQGHSVADAARLLGWDHKRAENTTYRAMAQLRGLLSAMGHGPAGPREGSERSGALRRV